VIVPLFPARARRLTPAERRRAVLVGVAGVAAAAGAAVGALVAARGAARSR